jgi:hypothetical protein
MLFETQPGEAPVTVLRIRYFESATAERYGRPSLSPPSGTFRFM